MKQAENVCPICGQPTYLVYGRYPRKDGLCSKCGKDLRDGLIEQCPICGKWNNADEICECKKETITEKTSKNNEITCLICGKPSNGKHFCINCYNKFKNKVLYIKIKNCIEFEKLEAEYESSLVCDDGHMVKSPYEKIIDNYLYKENIKHAYEKKIDVSKEVDITPDFYLEEYNGIKDIYIEFWGYDETNVKYQQTKEWKMKIYPTLVKKEEITVLYLTKKEVDDDSFKKAIKYIEAKKINQL